MFQLIYQLLAFLLPLAGLLLIHELGHLLAALLLGIDVEIFSIGLGSPLLSWRWQKIQWQIGRFPFGGYVAIAKKRHSPLLRLAISLAGPLANILLAFAIFTSLWQRGGREIPFSAQTNIIGWVDPSSALYEQGLRPGDRIVECTADQLICESRSEGNRRSFALENGQLTGVRRATQLVVQRDPPQPLRRGDRIVALDGQPLFSIEQLKRYLTEPLVPLRILRKGCLLGRRVTRLPSARVQLNEPFAEELLDWSYEQSLSLDELWTIPYSCSR